MLQVMDFGYPQFTEAKILSEYIKTDAHKMEVNDEMSDLAPAQYVRLMSTMFRLKFASDAQLCTLHLTHCARWNAKASHFLIDIEVTAHICQQLNVRLRQNSSGT